MSAVPQSKRPGNVFRLLRNPHQAPPDTERTKQVTYWRREHNAPPRKKWIVMNDEGPKTRYWHGPLFGGGWTTDIGKAAVYFKRAIDKRFETEITEGKVLRFPVIP